MGLIGIELSCCRIQTIKPPTWSQCNEESCEKSSKNETQLGEFKSIAADII